MISVDNQLVLLLKMKNSSNLNIVGVSIFLQYLQTQ